MTLTTSDSRRRLEEIANEWVDLTSRADYAHDLTFFGVPVYQHPTDFYLYQLLLTIGVPRLVVETGVAAGGSLIAIATSMETLHRVHNSSVRHGKPWMVIGVENSEKNLRAARKNLGKFSFFGQIRLVHGNSTSRATLKTINNLIDGIHPVMIFLDSDHAETHVHTELQRYAPLVSIGSFLVVWDSGLGRLSAATHDARPRAWSKLSYAGTGVQNFLNEDRAFGEASRPQLVFREDIAEPLLISGVSAGILQRIA